MHQQPLARMGQHHAAPGALEQRLVDGRLEPLHLLAERGLGPAERAAARLSARTSAITTNERSRSISSESAKVLAPFLPCIRTIRFHQTRRAPRLQAPLPLPGDARCP